MEGVEGGEKRKLGKLKAEMGTGDVLRSSFLVPRSSCGEKGRRGAGEKGGEELKLGKQKLGKLKAEIGGQ